MTLENVLIVSVISVLVAFGWWFIHRTRNNHNGKNGYSSAVDTYGGGPQMGFPIEKGVTDWQKHHQKVNEFEEVDALLKRVSTNPLSLQEQRVPVSRNNVDDPWAREYAQGLLHKIMPPKADTNRSE